MGIMHAQSDSLRYFLNQLRNKNLSDSNRALLNLKLSEQYFDIDPKQSFVYVQNAHQLSLKLNEREILCAAKRNIAKLFLNLGQYDSSLIFALQSYEMAKMLRNNILLFNSSNTLGNVYLEKVQLKEAKKMYDEALQLIYLDSSLPQKNHIYLNLGNYYIKSFNLIKSIEVFKQGIRVAKEENNLSDQMAIFGNIGYVYAILGKTDTAQQYLLTALNYYHKLKMLHQEANINEHLGAIYGLINNISRMDQYMTKAYEQYKAAGDNSLAINSLLQKVIAYFKLFQFTKCLQILNTVEYDAIKNNLTASLATSYLYKAAIMGLIGDTTNAVKFQRKSDELSQGINSPAFDKMKSMLNSVVLSSQLKLKQGDSLSKKVLVKMQKEIPKEMIDPTLESISLNKEVVNNNSEDFKHTFKVLHPQDSLNVKKVFDSLITRPIDSSMNAISNKQIIELETKYQTKQKEDSIHAQEQLIALKNKSILTRNYMLAILAILAILILILFLRSRTQSKKISRQYEEIQQLQSELKHRTGNFFNSINGMMAIATASTSDKETISSLAKRINTINRLYTTLYSSPDNNELPFSEFLGSLCNDFEHSFGMEKNIRVYHQCNASINKNEAVSLAYIITELLTNAEKYAFAGRQSGEIHVLLENENGIRRLHVWDNGSGIDETKTRLGSQGMGIIKSYCKNLNGKISTWNDKGLHFKMDF